MTKHLLIRDVRLRKGGFQLGVNGVQRGGGGGGVEVNYNKL